MPIFSLALPLCSAFFWSPFLFLSVLLFISLFCLFLFVAVTLIILFLLCWDNSNTDIIFMCTYFISYIYISLSVIFTRSNLPWRNHLFLSNSPQQLINCSIFQTLEVFWSSEWNYLIRTWCRTDLGLRFSNFQSDLVTHGVFPSA